LYLITSGSAVSLFCHFPIFPINKKFSRDAITIDSGVCR
jgi:hypothetical protein